MKIQILGMGCPKCQLLTERAEQAARELGLSYELVKVTDPQEIMSFGVMIDPRSCSERKGEGGREGPRSGGA